MAFGLLLGLIGLTVAGSEKMMRDVDDTIERNKAKKYGKLTYLDSYGHEHLTSNGRRVFTTTLPFNGDVVIEDIKTGKIYYNLTKMRLANKPKKIKKLCRASFESMPRGYQATFWAYVDREDQYVPMPKDVDCVEIFTPWNNKEMSDLFDTDITNRNKKNEWYRNMWNKRIYDRIYVQKWISYGIKTGDNSIKTSEDFIKINNYPTFEEFVEKYNL